MQDGIFEVCFLNWDARELFKKDFNFIFLLFQIAEELWFCLGFKIFAENNQITKGGNQFLYEDEFRDWTGPNWELTVTRFKIWINPDYWEPIFGHF